MLEVKTWSWKNGQSVTNGARTEVQARPSGARLVFARCQVATYSAIVIHKPQRHGGVCDIARLKCRRYPSFLCQPF